jgi:lactonase
MNLNTQLNGSGRGRLFVVAIAVLAMTALLAVASAGAAKKGGGGKGKTVYAKKLTRILPQGSEPVLFEGGAFSPEGNFVFANVLAKAGQPKLISLDPATKKWKSIHTDKDGTYTSTQFDAAGNLWVTDFAGKIDEMKPDGSDFHTTYSGKFAEASDDITFDRQGNMFVTNTDGTPFKPTGEVALFDPQGQNPKTFLGGLAAPNGISFTPDYSRLWVSEYQGQRELLLTPSKDHQSLAEAQVGMHGSPGIGHWDSNLVDSAGNIYQCVNEDGEVLVWNEHGELQETVKIKQNLGAPEMSATNLAIKPGTKTVYVVVGGKAGGFVYTFPALAKGYAGGSNGGSQPPATK